MFTLIIMIITYHIRERQQRQQILWPDKIHPMALAAHGSLPADFIDLPRSIA
jgi:hypothetical protein